MIEVRVAGRGSAKGDSVETDPAQKAHCDLCDADVDVVAAVGTAFACKACLRLRLDAMTLGTYQLSSNAGLPWGVVTS